MASSLFPHQDQKVGLRDFETFFREILAQSFGRLDQRKVGTLTHQEVLLISQSFQDTFEEPTEENLAVCLEKLGTREVNRDLFVDYMLTETLGGKPAEEQKRYLARLLGIYTPPGGDPSSSGGKAKELDKDWRETIMRIQAN